ncbi:hypothetical protein B0H11DRAFT_2259114 [Mycena galericulata]|nr:hypothetical protein B0H11DRAFT_2259114 [Mycena galericulata]
MATKSKSKKPFADEPPAIKGGHIRFFLFRDYPSFYLEIPVERIEANCKWPIRYLRYLAFVLVGLDGQICTSKPSNSSAFMKAAAATKNLLGDKDKIQEGETYHFDHPDAQFSKALKHAVELKVACSWLSIRDNVCIFTDDLGAQAHHIVPLSKGAAGLELIKDTRITKGQKSTDVSDIDDPRNGLYLSPSIHAQVKYFGILPTPNPILQMDDVPPRFERDKLPSHLDYPEDSRFTFQWIGYDDERRRHDAKYHWQGRDAAFVREQPEDVREQPEDLDEQPEDLDEQPEDLDSGSEIEVDSEEADRVGYDPYTAPYQLPSEFLLHYAYAGVVLRHWASTLEPFTRKSIPRREKKVSLMNAAYTRLTRRAAGHGWLRTHPKDKDGGKGKGKGEGGKRQGSSRGKQRGATQDSQQRAVLSYGGCESDSDSDNAGDLVLQLSLAHPEIRGRLDESALQFRNKIIAWQLGTSDTRFSIDLDSDGDSASGSGHSEEMRRIEMLLS